jgi:uncharacterized protein (TIGR00299 family) protein
MTQKRPLEKGLHLHFDPISGIAGDMTVAALVHAGVPQKVIIDAVKAMGVKGLKVSFEPRRRGSFMGLGYLVDWPGAHALHTAHAHVSAPKHEHSHHHEKHHHHHDELGKPHGEPVHIHPHSAQHGHPHRPYSEICRLLKRAKLDPQTKKITADIFDRIAKAEAELHGIPVEQIAFHEVGAWDSIADIVGASAALAWLDPSGVTSSPPVLGSGTVRTAHGLMPVPAPATTSILQNIPVCDEGQGELTTPTGAAILASIVTSFSATPPLILRAQGFGAGTKEFADRSNVLRVLLGEPCGQALPPSPAEVFCVSTNIDDMNPQLMEPLMTALFKAGALDGWITPIQMKKGRPAFCVSALCQPEALAEIEAAFFLNSTTLGLRRQAMQRTVLSRSLAKVKTSYGEVTVKIAAQAGTILGGTPEFEDCLRLANKAQVPVRKVIDDARVAMQSLLRR